jgi:ribosomal protein S27AE
MRDYENLLCPACGEPSDRPLATFVAKPRWKCGCGYSVMLPKTQVQAMLARIEQARKLVRFAEAAE